LLREARHGVDGTEHSLDFLPLLLAMLVGGVIGLEREMHGRRPGCVPTSWSA
jgi:uncharacterized membrane protein YhiD involved in acid resistance